MCVIICAETTKPTLQMLKDYEEVNSDGGGIAWIGKDGRVRWHKGIDAEKMFRLVETLDLPFICHFRISTVGGKPKELCHPFPITNKCSTDLGGVADRVLFHNGHWHQWQDMVINQMAHDDIECPDGEWSDTRGLAWLQARNRDIDIVANVANKDGGYFAVLSKDGITKYGRSWDTYAGCDVSNLFMWSSYYSYNDYDWTYTSSNSKTYRPKVWNYGKEAIDDADISITKRQRDLEDWAEEMERRHYGSARTIILDNDEITEIPHPKFKVGGWVMVTGLSHARSPIHPYHDENLIGQVAEIKGISTTWLTCETVDGKYRCFYPDELEPITKENAMEKYTTLRMSGKSIDQPTSEDYFESEAYCG